MAKPDTDDGWLKYAHELDAALAAADFTKGARIVLREVFAQIFGPAKLNRATLAPSAIAKRTGLDRARVYFHIKDLVASGVLKPHPKHQYAFVKDYERWTRNGAPRLSPLELRYAHDAPDHALSFVPRTVRKPIDASAQDVCQSSHTQVSEVVTELSQKCDQPVTNLSQSSHTSTIGTRTRFETLRLETTTTPSPLTDSTPTRTPLPAVEYTPLGHAILGPGHRECVDLARSLFGDEFAEVVADRGRDITFTVGDRWDCFAAAVRFARRQVKPIRDLYGYCRKTAEGYAMTGIPPAPVSSAPAHAPIEYHVAPADFVWGKSPAAKSKHAI